MTQRRYALRDDQRIQNLLPGRQNTVGGTARYDRLFVDSVLYCYRARDLSERFGDWKNAHHRPMRWSEKGVWEIVFKQLAQESDEEYVAIDSSIVRAYQSGTENG